MSSRLFAFTLCITLLLSVAPAAEAINRTTKLNNVQQMQKEQLEALQSLVKEVQTLQELIKEQQALTRNTNRLLKKQAESK